MNLGHLFPTPPGPPPDARAGLVCWRPPPPLLKSIIRPAALSLCSDMAWHDVSRVQYYHCLTADKVRSEQPQYTTYRAGATSRLCDLSVS
ncbi:hypothetical protein VDGL01_12585 [Verticillium dahliae]